MKHQRLPYIPLLFSIEDTYDRYQQFAGAETAVNGDPNRNDNQDEASSDLQSQVKEIATWSVQNNAEESDANELEQLENLLRNALRKTRSKKMQMLGTQNSGGSTSCSQNCKERLEHGTGCPDI
ncbi:unnamed protein product [Urochloa humidicola]